MAMHEFVMAMIGIAVVSNLHEVCMVGKCNTTAFGSMLLFFSTVGQAQALLLHIVHIQSLAKQMHTVLPQRPEVPWVRSDGANHHEI